MKRCYQCKLMLPLSKFASHKNRSDGKQSHCKECAKAQQTKWYYKRKFGITLEQRDAMLTSQNNQCKICEREIEFAPVGGGKLNNTDKWAVVDHCHVQGHIRGILCGKCNTALGGFSDNIQSLNNAITYLQN